MWAVGEGRGLERYAPLMGEIPRNLTGANDLESFQGSMTGVICPGAGKEAYSERSLPLPLLGDSDLPSWDKAWCLPSTLLFCPVYTPVYHLFFSEINSLGSISLQTHLPFPQLFVNKILRITASLIITTYQSLGNRMFPTEPHEGSQIPTLLTPTLNVVQVRPLGDFCTWPGLQPDTIIKFCGCPLSFHLPYPWHSQAFREGIWVIFFNTFYKGRILCAGVRGTLSPKSGAFGPCTHRPGPTAAWDSVKGKVLRETVSLVTFLPVLGVGRVLGRLLSSAPTLAAQ